MKFRNSAKSRTESRHRFESRKRFEFEKLEDRNLLSGTSGLVHVDLSGRTDFTPLITSGDANGTPPVTPADIIDPNVPTSPFAGVVALNPNGTNVCTGSVISEIHILTAAHCVDFDDDGVADISLAATEVHFNHQDAEIVFTGIQAAIAHPDYTGFANPSVNDDIAILILNEPIPAGVPIYGVNLEWTDPELIYLAGYGTSGDAINGYTIGAGHDDKRVGQNLAGGFELDDEGSGSREVFLFDNDGPDASEDWLGDGPTLGNDIEVFIGGGDSGGPSFLWNDTDGNGMLVPGELTVFGVNTFSGGGGLAGAPFYGSQGGGMNVAAYLDFLDDFIAFGFGEIEVSVDGSVLQVGDTLDFGVTKLGEDISKTITVTNLADTVLTLDPSILVTGSYNVDSSFGQLDLDQNEFTTFTVSFNAGSMGSFNGSLSFLNTDSDESPFSLSLIATVVPPIGEAGIVNVSNSWHTVTLGQTYVDPVVVAGPASFNESDPATVRVRNVTANTFQIRVQEWTYENGPHAQERLSYVVMESGMHRLSDGTVIMAGNADGVTTAKVDFVEVDFITAFSGTPVVVAQAVTYNGGAPIVTRLDNITNSSFQVSFQEEEAADQKHNPERVSWLAFMPDEGTLGLSKYDTTITDKIVDEDVSALRLRGQFDEAPVFLANMQTFVGSNTAGLRLADIDATNAYVFVEEEQSRDEETGHGDEVVGFLAIEQGDILGRTIIGEAGTINGLDRDWQTITLAQEYLDPVVIASGNTMNESDPFTIRVRNVTNNSFDIHIEEWNYLNLNHAPESVSFMVFESGVHRLRDGQIIEARNSLVDVNDTTLVFAGDKGGEAPVVFTQVTTDNGPSTVTTRVKKVNPVTFQMYLQEEQASFNHDHVTETVSWVAVNQSAGVAGDVRYEALLHEFGVNHKSATVPLTNAFVSTPVIISGMQTVAGTDPATLRNTSINSGGVDLFVQEEQSLDAELGHLPEDVGVFAVSRGIIDGFIVELFETLPIIPTGSAFSSSVTQTAGSLENNSIQQMLIRSAVDESLQDSAFAAFDGTNNELVHIDIDESTVVPLAGMVSLTRASRAEVASSPSDSADDGSGRDAIDGSLEDQFETI